MINDAQIAARCRGPNLSMDRPSLRRRRLSRTCRLGTRRHRGAGTQSKRLWRENHMTDAHSGPFPKLGSPIRLAGLTVPNRTVMAAMSSGLSDVEGQVTDNLIAYYRARAEGGTGLIV